MKKERQENENTTDVILIGDDDDDVSDRDDLAHQTPNRFGLSLGEQSGGEWQAAKARGPAKLDKQICGNTSDAPRCARRREAFRRRGILISLGHHTVWTAPLGHPTD